MTDPYPYAQQPDGNVDGYQWNSPTAQLLYGQRAPTADEQAQNDATAAHYAAGDMYVLGHGWVPADQYDWRQAYDWMNDPNQTMSSMRLNPADYDSPDALMHAMGDKMIAAQPDGLGKIERLPDGTLWIDEHGGIRDNTYYSPWLYDNGNYMGRFQLSGDQQIRLVDDNGNVTFQGNGMEAGPQLMDSLVYGMDNSDHRKWTVEQQNPQTGSWDTVVKGTPGPGLLGNMLTAFGIVGGAAALGALALPALTGAGGAGAAAGAGAGAAAGGAGAAGAAGAAAAGGLGIVGADGLITVLGAPALAGGLSAGAIGAIGGGLAAGGLAAGLGGGGAGGASSGLGAFDPVGNTITVAGAPAAGTGAGAGAGAAVGAGAATGGLAALSGGASPGSSAATSSTGQGTFDPASNTITVDGAPAAGTGAGTAAAVGGAAAAAGGLGALAGGTPVGPNGVPEAAPADITVTGGTTATAGQGAALGGLTAGGLAGAAAGSGATAAPKSTLDKISDYLQLGALGTALLGNALGGSGSNSGGASIGTGANNNLNSVFHSQLPSNPSIPGVGPASNLGPRTMPDQDWNTYAMHPEQSFFNYVPQQSYTPAPPQGGLPSLGS